jgi:hypothetical protein
MGLRQTILNSHDLRGEIAPTVFCLKGKTSETTVSNKYALRRSLTCGYENPAFQAVRRGACAHRRSLTYGRENYVLSGHSTFSEGGNFPNFPNFPNFSNFSNFPNFPNFPNLILENRRQFCTFVASWSVEA